MLASGWDAAENWPTISDSGYSCETEVSIYKLDAAGSCLRFTWGCDPEFPEASALFVETSVADSQRCANLWEERPARCTDTGG